MCASGMKSIIFAAQAIATGYRSVCVVGGMESMSNAPYYVPKARQGYRLGT
jgi:acetyl-CoA C-acetyltransferase